MNINIIDYINTLLDNTKITEFTIQKRDEKITISRDPHSLFKNGKSANVFSKPASSKKSEGPKSEEIDEKNLIKVISKTVGVFYRGKTKIAPPLIKMDSPVKKGDQLGIINSVGVIEKVNAPTSGIIKEILVDNHKPVEFGQPLFVIQTK